MDITIMVRAGMLFAAVGLFLAAYYRFRNPVRLEFARERRAPQLSGAGSPAADPGVAATDRRAPSI